MKLRIRINLPEMWFVHTPSRVVVCCLAECRVLFVWFPGISVCHMSQEAEWFVTLNFSYGNEKIRLMELLNIDLPRVQFPTFLHDLINSTVLHKGPSAVYYIEYVEHKPTWS
jgi:hypothetical protein